MKPRLELAPGASAEVSVPASSANLGPGFDSLGLALDLWDNYRVVVREQPGVVVGAEGESEVEVPRDESHLVASSLLEGLRDFGADTSGIGLHLECKNLIPHGRGLGSSAAAIVGGVRLAAALAGVSDRDAVLQVAARLEGHPDNAAAALYGGFVISWISGSRAGAVRCAVHPDVRLVVFIPDFRSPTEAARQALPSSLPYEQAAFNASRSALLVHAITSDPSFLLPATEDRMHQEQRRQNYPEAMELIDRLRQERYAAVISGAGPAVLVLAVAVDVPGIAEIDHVGFRRMMMAVG